jgi:signal transduction histidine kinase/CheY-like chemotaxis protein
VAIFGVLLSVAAYALARRAEQRRDEAEFHRQIASHLAGFQERRNGAEDVLRTLRALIKFKPDLSREQFRETIADLAIRLEGVQAIAWAPLVRAHERESVERRAQAEGFPEFRITEGDIVHLPEDGPVPAGAREHYLPVMFLEPYVGNEHVLGYDVLTVPEVREAVETSRVTGGITLSTRVRVPHEGAIANGVIAVIPVFRPALVPGTEAQQEEQFLGCVLGVFILPQLLQSLQQRIPDLWLDVLVLDVTVPGRREILEAHLYPPGSQASGLVTEEEFRARPHLAHTLEISGRTLEVLFRRGAGWRYGLEAWYPLILLVAGLLLTAMLAQHLVFLNRRTRRVEDLVLQRTNELATANARLQAEIQERARSEAERKELDRQFQETQKLESLGLLAGGIAHDFNNLLTTVIGNVGLVRMELPQQGSVRTYLNEIDSASKRAADLCRQLLAYAGKGRIELRRLDLSGFVEDNLELLRLCVSKKVSLRLDLARDLPPVSGDPTQLRQILMNLVINGSEAIGDRPGVVRIVTRRIQADREFLARSVPLSDLKEGEYLALEVHDDGCGMTPEVQSRIFEPFYTTKFTGRGLGLAAVLGIARQHRGALTVESQPDKGTTFQLLLPPVAGRLEPALPSKPKGEPYRGQGTLLVADDEPSIRFFAGHILTKAGFEVQVAGDGAEALAIFARDPDRFRAVLLDLTMPRLDGQEAFSQIRQLRADVRVLLMSGFSHDEAMQRFAGQGLDGFIQKPFGPHEFLEALRRVLEPANEPAAHPPDTTSSPATTSQ